MNPELVEDLEEFDAKIKYSNESSKNLSDFLNLLIADKQSISLLKLIMKSYAFEYSDIIDFNVGGTSFSILKSNIIKKISKPNSNINEYYNPNMLERLINGLVTVKHDKNNAIFIDRDPKYFGYILNYLRTANTEETFQAPKNEDDIKGLLKEAQYYQIRGLVDLFVVKFDSLILDKNLSVELINLCGFFEKDKWDLIYQGSRHGFGAKDFHSKCDGHPNTLTIIKTSQLHIFGGYVNVSWDTSGLYKQDRNSFIFSLVNRDHTQVKMNFDAFYGNNSIQCNSSYGPTFGGGHDIYVSDQANSNSLSYSNLGYNYKHPLYSYNTNEAKSFLAGSYNFQVSEIEVYARN